MPKRATTYVRSPQLRARVHHLLDMLYSVTELAEELEIHPDMIRRVFLKEGGCPHERDTRGHIWINGQAFARWLTDHYPKAARVPYAPDEIYCMHCHKRTKFDPLPAAQPARWTRFTIATPVICRECGRQMRKISSGRQDD